MTHVNLSEKKNDKQIEPNIPHEINEVLLFSSFFRGSSLSQAKSYLF